MKERLLKHIDRSLIMPEFLSVLFVVLLFSVHLFVFGPEGYKNITLVKYISFVVLSGSYIAAMVVWIAAAGRHRGRIRTERAVSAAGALVTVYLLLTIVSALVSEFFPDTLIGGYRREGLLTIGLYCLIFLMLERYSWSGKWCIYVIGAAATLYASVCILQLLRINIFSLFPEGFDYYGAGEKYSGEFLGTMGNAGFAAAFFSLAAPVLLVYISRAKERMRLWLLLPLLMSIFVLLYSRIAAGILGFFAGIYLALPFVFAEGKTRRIWLIGELVLAAAVLALIYVVDFEGGILYELHSILHGRFEDSFGTGRIFIWRNTLPLLTERPLLGGGPDTLARRIGVIFETVKEDGTVRKAAIDAAHNEYLHIAVCQGIPAAAAYIAALAFTFVRFLKSGSGDVVASALAAGLLCYSVQAFFGISMCIATPFFWAVWALLMRRLRYIEKERKKETIA